MSTKMSPLAQVKKTFGSKDKLVDALLAMPGSLIDRGEEEKDDFRKRLLGAANGKLLRLHQTASEIEKRWGGKEQLVEAYLSLMNRGKDQDYRGKLATYSLGKLRDLAVSTERRTKRAQKAAVKKDKPA